MKDSLRSDPRYKSVKHEDREKLFNEYVAELKAAVEETAQKAKAKQDEEVRQMLPSDLWLLLVPIIYSLIVLLFHAMVSTIRFRCVTWELEFKLYLCSILNFVT